MPRQKLSPEEKAIRVKEAHKRWYEKMRADPERLAHHRTLQNKNTKVYWANHPEEYAKHCLNKSKI